MAKYHFCTMGRFGEDEKLIYSTDKYYEIMQKISTVGLFHALYLDAKINIKQNQKFITDFCPIHRNTPGRLAFSINEGDMYWQCRGCFEAGMTVDLIIRKYSLYGIKQDKAIEILSLLCEKPLTDTFDDEQIKIYNEIRDNYSYDNNYKRDSDCYTKIITDRFKTYLDKNGWTKEIYDKASIRYDGVRSTELDKYFDDIKREEMQKQYKKNRKYGEDLPF